MLLVRSLVAFWSVETRIHVECSSVASCDSSSLWYNLLGKHSIFLPTSASSKLFSDLGRAVLAPSPEQKSVSKMHNIMDCEYIPFGIESPENPGFQFQDF